MNQSVDDFIKLSDEVRGEMLAVVLNSMREAAAVPGAIERQQTILRDFNLGIAKASSEAEILVVLATALFAAAKRSPFPMLTVLAVGSTVTSALRGKPEQL